MGGLVSNNPCVFQRYKEALRGRLDETEGVVAVVRFEDGERA